MKTGLIGKKVGMTQIFDEAGKVIPVTVIEAGPCVVAQIKTKETDGYDAVQLAFGDKKEKNSNKPELGHFKKANTTPKRFLKEIRGVDVSNYQLGMEIKADIFENGEMVDVTGTSKGKGFQGVIKRHNQTRGPMGHGSQYHRGVGSMGTMLPMRVLPGKKLPGHMGNATRTIQNLEIIEVDLKNNVILIKGNVPGPKKSIVFIRSAIKNQGKVNAKEDLVTYITDVEEVTEEVANTENNIESSQEA